MIKTVIRYPDRFVLVFDEKGEQMPGYQGIYANVKRRIMRDAPDDARFKVRLKDANGTLKTVPREEW